MRTLAPAAAPIFRSDQQMRILAVLFEHQGVELSISELARASGVAMGTASREAERLEAHGLLRARNVGRSRFVSANWELAWADSLADILAHTAGLPYRLSASFAEVSGVERAYVYGSWAARHAGEVGPSPRDIDLLVIGTAEVYDVRRALRPLEQALSIEINAVVMSAEEWSEAESPFLDEVRSRPMFEVDLSGSRLG